MPVVGRLDPADRTYVGLLERGLRMPSILVAKKVAAALGITTAELIAEVERE